MEAVRFVVDTLLWLLTLAFVLRLLFQWVRANFRDPLADAIVRVSNWLVLPLRRILPPIGKLDTATAVAVLLIALAHSAALLLLGGFGFGIGALPYLLRSTVVGLLDLVLRIYLFAMLLYWITSVVASGTQVPGTLLLAQLCEPILKRVRRVIPPIGQMDFSMLWASIAIGALLILLR